MVTVRFYSETNYQLFLADVAVVDTEGVAVSDSWALEVRIPYRMYDLNQQEMDTLCSRYSADIIF